MTLKDGSTPSDPRLGRIPQQDLRSLNFLVSARREASLTRKPRSYSWSVGTVLDQGQEGACVGFGYSHDLAARPVPVMGVTNLFAFERYWDVQREDPWPGGAYAGATPKYDGTSVLTGAKVFTDRGFYSGYDWAMNAAEVAQAIGYTGPSILGLDWYVGMFDPDKDGFLRLTGGVAGGHCICAVGVKIVYKPVGLIKWIFNNRTWVDVDMAKSYIVVHNSWGSSWGDNGNAKISLADLDTLLKAGGEACFPRRTLKKST